MFKDKSINILNYIDKKKKMYQIDIGVKLIFLQTDESLCVCVL